MIKEITIEWGKNQGVTFPNFIIMLDFLLEINVHTMTNLYVEQFYKVSL